MDEIKTAFTYAEYLLLSDEKRYEILEGDLMMVPAPGAGHQRVIGELYTLLKTHVESRRLGEVFVAPFDVILAESDVVQPDIIFVSRDRAKLIEERGCFGAPDLVVEILSPGTASRDRQIKTRIYARAGVGEMWILDIDARRVEVFRPQGDAMRLVKLFEGADKVASDVLPDIELRPADVFRKT